MTYFNDIGLLVVREGFDPNNESITFAPELATLLPESKSKEQSTKAGEICRIAGWGHTRPVLTIPEIYAPMGFTEILQEGKVVIKSVKNCEKAFNLARQTDRQLEILLRPFHIDATKNICAHGRKGKVPIYVTDACSVSMLNAYNLIYCIFLSCHGICHGEQ